MSDPGYPAGAEHDPNAPYNQSNEDNASHLCRYCNKGDELFLINEKDYDSEEEYDEALEELASQMGLCRNCEEEERADYIRDMREDER